MRKEKLHSEKVSDIYTHAYIHTHTHAPTLSHTDTHTYVHTHQRLLRNNIWFAAFPRLEE